jgi:hypothetical protein
MYYYFLLSFYSLCLLLIKELAFPLLININPGREWPALRIGVTYGGPPWVPGPPHALNPPWVTGGLRPSWGPLTHSKSRPGRELAAGGRDLHPLVPVLALSG